MFIASTSLLFPLTKSNPSNSKGTEGEWHFFPGFFLINISRKNMQNQAVLKEPQPQNSLQANRGRVPNFPQVPVEASGSLVLSTVGLCADENHVIPI